MRHPRMLLVVLLCGLWWGPAHATIYYVDGAVAAGNSCAAATQLTTPRRTIAAGVACLTPGDTLLIRGGTYNELFSPVGFRLPSGTNESTRITIAGYPGETVVIPNQINIQDNFDASIPQYLTLDNLTSPHLEISINSHHITVSNSNFTGGDFATVGIARYTDHVRLVGNKIHGARLDLNYVGDPNGIPGQYGCYCNGTNMTMDGNEFYDNYGYAIHLYLSGGGVDNAVVTNNLFHENCFNDGTRGQGLNVIIMNGGNNLLANNILYNNVCIGNGAVVSISPGTGGFGVDNNRVYNNTITQNPQSAAIEINVGNTNTKIQNNILTGNADTIQDDGATGTIRDHNLLTGDPLFVNAAAGDFRLQAGSPAIDAGVTLAAVPTDRRGIARPQGAAYDLGAEEYGSGVVTTGPQALRWKFDEGTGTTVADATGNGYTGTLAGGPLWGPGRVGTGAVTMNGVAQYVTTATMVWTAGQPVTVLLWRKVTAGGVTGAFGAHSAAVQDRFGAHLPYSDNVCYWDYGDWHTVGRVSVDCTPYLGRWVRFALVSSGATSSVRAIYANGALVASAPSSTAPTVDLTVFDVGRWVNESGTYYDPGSVDDFRLDNRVWSAAEILTDYRQSATVRRHRVSMR